MSKQEIDKSIEAFIKKSDEKIYNLQIELKKMEICKNIYKERWNEIHSAQTDRLYALICSYDNGEGANTEECIGVFRKKSDVYSYMFNNNKYDLKTTYTIEDYKNFHSKQLDENTLLYVLYENKEFYGTSYDEIVTVSTDAKDFVEYTSDPTSCYWQETLKLM